MKEKTKTIAVTLQKGGLGKTSCTVNLASVLATRRPTKYSKRRNKVLIIDMDVHATASHYLDVYDERALGIYDVLTGNCNFDDAIVKKEFQYGPNIKTQIDIVPSYTHLHVIETKWKEYENPEMLLYNALKKSQKINEYDYVFIDCPPESDCLLSNIYNVSEYYILPVFADTQSHINVGITYEQIKTLSTNDNEKHVLGCIVNNFEKNELSLAYLQFFQNNAIIPCFKTVIPKSRRYDQTLHFKMPVPFYHRNIHNIYPLNRAFNQFADEFLEKIKSYN